MSNELYLAEACLRSGQSAGLISLFAIDMLPTAKRCVRLTACWTPEQCAEAVSWHQREMARKPNAERGPVPAHVLALLEYAKKNLVKGEAA